MPRLTDRARRLIAGRLPWWVAIVLGIVIVGIGVVLIARPFQSLSMLHWIVAVALVVGGLSEIVTAPRAPRPALEAAAGTSWIALGVLAVAWPAMTLVALAAVLTAALLVGGVVRAAEAVTGRGEDRLLLGIGGVTLLIAGLVAVSWPAVTILVLSVVAGVSAVLFGAGQVAMGLRLRDAAAGGGGAGTAVIATQRLRRPQWTRVAGSILALLLALGGAAISVAVHRADPDEPGSFYTAPSPLPDGAAGTIIRSEIIDGYWPGAITYRVLYLSTGLDGEPAAVSGLVVVPDGPAPDEGRRVLAYTHGTVGVTPKCAPSLTDAASNPLFMEGGAEFIDAGYVIAASDYQGLGTPGTHPYLVGDIEAKNELDVVRAAHNLTEAATGTSFVVWGHSQGGHASLFTGQLAADYAPELDLRGVAAGGPVPDLIHMFAVNIETPVGKILIAMALNAWAEVYDDASLDQIVTPVARPVVRRLADTCLYSTTAILGSLPSALLLDLTFVSAPPWEAEPWATIASENTPGSSPTGVPMLVVQGLADTIVAPELTASFVDRLCAAGETVDYRTYEGIDHLETGVHAAADVMTWVDDRFAGGEAPTSC